MMKLTFLYLMSIFCPGFIIGQNYSTNRGRQLFVDLERIENTNLEQVYHLPAYYKLNPVLKADNPWEFNAMGDPYAAPFSGGVWYDELQGKYRMWYSAGGNKVLGLITCYAESDDGKHWVKPVLDIVAGTNIVDTTEHDCVTVWMDKQESDLQKKFKMFIVEFNGRFTVSMKLKYSSDGIHWGKPVALSGEIYDRCSVYYDPFIQQYVLSLKTMTSKGRSRNYLTMKDPELLVSLAHRTYDSTSDKFIRYWFSADDDDPRNPQFPQIHPQIYNHDATAYENRILGYFTVWQGPENEDCDSLKIQKRNEVLIGWLNDDFTWNRTNKKPFFTVDENYNSWNSGNIQSTAGNPLIVGDSLYFYMSGRYNSKPKHDSNFSTGLATLRRDGFVSMHTKSKGFLQTLPFVCKGEYLFVNADVCKGSIIAEVQDEHGKALPGYESNGCIAIKKKNSTKQMIVWKTKKGLSDLSGKNIRLKFYLTNGDLYSFWISSWNTGESNGFTAGGGPGLNPSGVDSP